MAKRIRPRPGRSRPKPLRRSGKKRGRDRDRPREQQEQQGDSGGESKDPLDRFLGSGFPDTGDKVRSFLTTTGVLGTGETVSNGVVSAVGRLLERTFPKDLREGNQVKGMLNDVVRGLKGQKSGATNANSLLRKFFGLSGRAVAGGTARAAAQTAGRAVTSAPGLGVLGALAFGASNVQEGLENKQQIDLARQTAPTGKELFNQLLTQEMLLRNRARTASVAGGGASGLSSLAEGSSGGSQPGQQSSTGPTRSVSLPPSKGFPIS